METVDTSAVVAQIAAEAESLGMWSSMSSKPPAYQISQRRRRGRLGALSDPTVTVSLVLDKQGRLQWSEGAYPSHSGRRRARRGPITAGQVVDQYTFEPLGPNQVVEFLGKLDKKLTPHQGLRKWTGTSWVPVDEPSGRSRVLVLIHGTFSTGEQLMDDLRHTTEGEKLMGKAHAVYDEVLSFDHPTLSVSPWINAIALATKFRGCDAHVDVIAHSRGGLVARWWLDVLRPTAQPVSRAILVGSPLAGTSLATPAALRSSLSLLTNYGRVLETLSRPATVFAPFLSVPLGLLKIVTSITSLASKTPVLDAALALVPGLHAQSRSLNNHEMISLTKSGYALGADYAVIASNFEPDDPVWQFWKWFRKPNLADPLADFVFDGDNDLVVDSGSVQAIEVRNPDRVLSFGKKDAVHHCNYFEAKRTIDFIGRRLALG